MEKQFLKKQLLLHHPDKGGDRDQFDKYFSMFKKFNDYKKQFSYINLKYKDPIEFLKNLNI